MNIASKIDLDTMLGLAAVARSDDEDKLHLNDVPEKKLHDVLVDLFSDGLYGNSWCTVDVPDNETNDRLIDEWKASGQFGDCYEDKLAYVIRHGGTLYLLDIEDDVKYTIDIGCMNKGTQLFVSSPRFADFIKSNDDYYTGNAFIQYCTFGDIIYG